MITINTSDLIGPALDWAVTKCEEPVGGYEPWLQAAVDKGWVPFGSNYSTNWSAAGPIIERELISVSGNIVNGEPSWFSLKVKPDKSGCFKGNGPTPLIAAMRCFVASRLGDTVTFPANSPITLKE